MNTRVPIESLNVQYKYENNEVYLYISNPQFHNQGILYLS